MVLKLKEFSFESTQRGIRATRRDERTMKRIKNVDDMDCSFPNGIFTTPNQEIPNIRFRDMHKWCQENGRNPETLTKDELEKFKF